MDCSRSERSLFALLRIALWGQDAAGDCLQGMTADEWERTFLLARQQTVTALACQAVQMLPDEALPCDRLLMRWMAEADRIEHASTQMDEAVQTLCGVFRSAGLLPVVLKGQGVAQFYQQPSLREAGDIDLFFPREGERAKAESLLTSRGTALERLADGSSVYHWQDVEVEHHPSLFDLRSPSSRRVLDGLQRQHGFASQSLGGGSFSVPSPMLCLVLLSTHILKHAMGNGIGLRQFCDMACAIHALLPQVDKESLDRQFRLLGLQRWHRAMGAFLVQRLGLPAGECVSEGDEATVKAFERIVFEGGNFGHYKAGRHAPSAFGRKVHTAKSFLAHSRFSLRYAPMEAFWMFASLMKGQLKC